MKSYHTGPRIFALILNSYALWLGSFWRFTNRVIGLVTYRAMKAVYRLRGHWVSYCHPGSLSPFKHFKQTEISSKRNQWINHVVFNPSDIRIPSSFDIYEHSDHGDVYIRVNCGPRVLQGHHTGYTLSGIKQSAIINHAKKTKHILLLKT